jgi:hypothetical protein
MKKHEEAGWSAGLMLARAEQELKAADDMLIRWIGDLMQLELVRRGDPRVEYLLRKVEQTRGTLAQSIAAGRAMWGDLQKLERAAADRELEPLR